STCPRTTLFRSVDCQQRAVQGVAHVQSVSFLVQAQCKGTARQLDQLRFTQRVLVQNVQEASSTVFKQRSSSNKQLLAVLGGQNFVGAINGVLTESDLCLRRSRIKGRCLARLLRLRCSLACTEQQSAHYGGNNHF